MHSPIKIEVITPSRPNPQPSSLTTHHQSSSFLQVKYQSNIEAGVNKKALEVTGWLGRQLSHSKAWTEARVSAFMGYMRQL